MLNREYIVSNVEFKQTKNGKNYISMLLTTNDKEKIAVDGKIWSEHVEILKDKVKNGNLIKPLEGKLGSYQDVIQISLTDIELLKESQWGYTIEQTEEKYDKLIEITTSLIHNEIIQRVTLLTLGHYAQNPFFLRAPAAKSNHHNYPGGLIVHTLEVCETAIAIKNSDLYSELNWDIVIAACILHDLGKVEDYKITNQNLIETTEKIKLTGHLVSTPMEIFKIASSLEVEYSKEVNNLIHAVIAHHGKKEYGSPQTPATKEAWMVHFADLISSQITGTSLK